MTETQAGIDVRARSEREDTFADQDVDARAAKADLFSEKHGNHKYQTFGDVRDDEKTLWPLLHRCGNTMCRAARSL